MEIKYIKVDKLNPADYNPRQMTEKQEQELIDSLQAFGFAEPIVVNSNPKRKNVIIGGHQRVNVAKQIGITEIPCVFYNLDEEKEKELNIRLNKNLGEWDYDLLHSFDLDLLTDIGFDETDLSKELDKLIEPEEDEAPEVDKTKTESKLGEVYELGNHRLMCGDATKKEDVEKLMDGKKADMVFTDPPYGIDFTGNVHADGSKSHNSKFGKLKNDKLSDQGQIDFINDYVGIIKQFTIGAYYICWYRLGLHQLFNGIINNDLDYKALIIWDKGNHTLSNSDYQSKFEPIVYGWIDKHNFYGGRSNFDLWDIERTKKNILHPTMKPIALVINAIKNSSKQDDIVLDLFGGSGSTLIAAEQTNRTCYMMELDPKYCDVIRKRYDTFNNK